MGFPIRTIRYPAMVANPPAYPAPADHPVRHRVVLAIKNGEVSAISEGMPSGGK